MAKRKYKAHFRIDRAKWLTGEALSTGAVEDSSLRDAETGLMCCLGQVCRQLGVRPADLKNQYYPDGLLERISLKKRTELIGVGLLTPTLYDSALTQNLIQINDNAGLDRKSREAKVKDFAAREGIRVTFAGKYPDYEKIAKRFERATVTE